MMFFGWLVRLGHGIKSCVEYGYGSIYRLDKAVSSGVLRIEASRNGHWIILAFLYYSPAGNMHIIGFLFS